MAVMIVVLWAPENGFDDREFKKTLAAYSRCQISDNAWLIDTSLSISIVKNELSLEPDANGSVFIADLSRTWKFHNGGRPEEWLGAASRRWTVSPRWTFWRWLRKSRTT